MAYYGSTSDSGDPTTRYDPNAPNTNPEGTNGVFHDAQGRAYVLDPQTGQRSYIASYADEQKGHDQSGLLSNSEWNPQTGQLEDHTNWGNIIGLAAGLEPLAAGGIALAGAGAGAGGAGAGGAAGGAGAAVPEIGLSSAPMGAIATPGLTGALSTSAGGAGILSTLEKIGQPLGNVLSNAGGGLAAGRRADANASNNAAAINNRSNLDAAEFNIGAPVTRAKQVAQGDLMSYNFAPASHTGSGRDLQITGGVGPWAFSDSTRQAGDALKRQGLNALLTNSDKLTPQQATGTTPGTGEDVLSGAGLGLNILSLLKGLV